MSRRQRNLLANNAGHPRTSRRSGKSKQLGLLIEQQIPIMGARPWPLSNGDEEYPFTSVCELLCVAHGAARNVFLSTPSFRHVVPRYFSCIVLLYHRTRTYSRRLRVSPLRRFCLFLRTLRAKWLPHMCIRPYPSRCFLWSEVRRFLFGEGVGELLR